MNDFLYDLRRTFTGKFTIVMLALIIVATVGIAYGSAALSSGSTASPQSTAYVMPEIYSVNGGYNITDYVVNGYGEPVSGLSISSHVYNSSINTAVNFTDVTDSMGYVHIHYSTTGRHGVEYNYSSEYISGIAVSPNTAYYVNSSKYQEFVPNYITLSYSSTSSYSVLNSSACLYMMSLSNPNSKVNNNLFVYYAAPNGADLPSASLWYRVENGSGVNFPPSTTHGMTFDQNLSGSNHFLLSLPLNSTANGNPVEIALFNSTDYFFAGSSGLTLYNSVSTASYLISILQLPYVFLIPIAGIFSAYFYYGKDKTSGVMESVITRPVTKGRVFISRFAGSSSTFLVSLLVAVFLADIILLHYTGTLMSARAFLSIVLGYTVEAIAFSGIMYVASQFIKSQGGLLGLGIGLVFLLGLFWTTIVDVILYVAHVNLATAAGYSLRIDLTAIGPTFYHTMILSYITGVYPPAFAGLSSGGVLASSLGITLVSVIIVGLIWVIVPSVISFLLARSRD